MADGTVLFRQQTAAAVIAGRNFGQFTRKHGWCIGECANSIGCLHEASAHFFTARRGPVNAGIHFDVQTNGDLAVVAAIEGAAYFEIFSPPYPAHEPIIEEEPENPVALKYRDGKRDVQPYLERRWHELGVPAAMKAISDRTGIHTDKEMSDLGKSTQRSRQRSKEFMAVQAPAFMRAVSELHWTKGMKDVGLSVKTSGNNPRRLRHRHHHAQAPRRGADDQEPAVADALVRGGYPQARIGWIGPKPWNNDKRPWIAPPTPDGEEPTVETHKYIGGGNDSGTCDRADCKKSRFDAVHKTALSKVPHPYDPGENGTGPCDECTQDEAAAIHQSLIPDPDSEPDPTDPPVDLPPAGWVAEAAAIRKALAQSDARLAELTAAVDALENRLGGVGPSTFTVKSITLTVGP